MKGNASSVLVILQGKIKTPRDKSGDGRGVRGCKGTVGVPFTICIVDHYARIIKFVTGLRMNLQIRGVKYILTKHAKHRMERRGVTLELLVDTLSNPKRERLQIQDDKATKLAISGMGGGDSDITVITTVGDKERVIITVYKYAKQHYLSKEKNNYNKRKRSLKKKFGNRLKRT